MNTPHDRRRCEQEHSMGAELLPIPREELERAIKALRYAAHPHPSPNADALEAYLSVTATETIVCPRCEGECRIREFGLLGSNCPECSGNGFIPAPHPLAGEQAGAVVTNDMATDLCIALGWPTEANVGYLHRAWKALETVLKKAQQPQASGRADDRLTLDEMYELPEYQLGMMVIQSNAPEEQRSLAFDIVNKIHRQRSTPPASDRVQPVGGSGEVTEALRRLRRRGSE